MAARLDRLHAQRQWIEITLRDELAVRDARWSEAVAVGSLAFVEKVKGELGAKALHRELEQIDGTYALRESGEAYRGQIDSKNEALRPENDFQELPKLRQLTVGDPAHIREQAC